MGLWPQNELAAAAAIAAAAAPASHIRTGRRSRSARYERWADELMSEAQGLREVEKSGRGHGALTRALSQRRAQQQLAHKRGGAANIDETAAPLGSRSVDARLGGLAQTARHGNELGGRQDAEAKLVVAR